MREACRGAKESRQLEHYRTKLPIWPRSQLTTRFSRRVESPECPVWVKLTFRIPHHLYYIYSHYPQKFLQSLLLPSPINIPIERRFVSKHYPRPFKVLRVFLKLWEALEKMPRMADAVWSLLRDPVSQRKQGSA